MFYPSLILSIHYSFFVYQQDLSSSISSLFNSESGKYWLGGFVEGEGTVCASIKLDSNPKLKRPKIRVDLEFLVTQHYNGVHILNAFLILFDGNGHVRKKSGSDVCWDYRLKGLDNLWTYVVPFYQTYVLPFSGKRTEFNVFYQILLLQRDKAHLTKEGLIQIVKLAYTLNEEGKGSKRKRSLADVISIIEAQFDTSD